MVTVGDATGNRKGVFPELERGLEPGVVVETKDPSECCDPGLETKGSA